jgi:hypothetical protein
MSLTKHAEWIERLKSRERHNGWQGIPEWTPFIDRRCEGDPFQLFNHVVSIAGQRLAAMAEGGALVPDNEFTEGEVLGRGDGPENAR